MAERTVIVKRGTYRDSITLMKISNTVLGLQGVSQAAVLMATELNKKLLKDVGFGGSKIDAAATEDMVIAIEARDERSLNAAVQKTEAFLSAGEEPSGGSVLLPSARSIGEALEAMPEANLVMISVPGQFAKREALNALAMGLNVFLFSSNVPRADEVELKRLAREKGLLMMGPDCGTSIISHKVLGFGNKIREGPVGIVSAAGTGLQEVSTLIHKAGVGISQAIGTGGGDLSEEVGGITTIEGIHLLERDPSTKLILVISKPPGPRAIENVLRAVRSCKKTVVLNFLGADLKKELRENEEKRIVPARTLEGAARAVCKLSGVSPGKLVSPEELDSKARREYTLLAKGQRYIRGLFAGGTICYESQLILVPLFQEVYSNSPLRPESKIEGDAPSRQHQCIDMGAEEFVGGRPHPMIDFTLRNRRILREARDNSTAVILLDVELGYGSNSDPAGQLVPVIAEAKAIASKGKRYLSFVACVIGTAGDLQDLAGQEKRLEDAGVIVMPSSSSAAKLAALIASRGEMRDALSLGSFSE